MQQQFKVFKIIHVALVIGLILVYIVLNNNSIDIKNLSFPKVNSEDLIYVLIPLIAYFISQLLYKQLISKIDTTQDQQQILLNYQSANIVRWAIIEGAAFLILILKPEFILFGCILIIYIALLHPTEYKYKRDLNLFS